MLRCCPFPLVGSRPTCIRLWYIPRASRIVRMMLHRKPVSTTVHLCPITLPLSPWRAARFAPLSSHRTSESTCVFGISQLARSRGNALARKQAPWVGCRCNAPSRGSSTIIPHPIILDVTINPFSDLEHSRQISQA